MIIIDDPAQVSSQMLAMFHDKSSGLSTGDAGAGDDDDSSLQLEVAPGDAVYVRYAVYTTLEDTKRQQQQQQQPPAAGVL